MAGHENLLLQVQVAFTRSPIIVADKELQFGANYIHFLLWNQHPVTLVGGS